jgi:hypothetical protein
MSGNTMIVDLLLDRLVEQLTLKCITELTDPNDPTKADFVKKGLLQENKLQKNIQIGVQGGDHEDPNYRDGITSLSELPNIGWRVPVREVGGGEMWWRRGVVRIETFFVGANANYESQAHQYAYELLGRVEETIAATYVADLVDSFGEHAELMFTFGNTFFESGGAPKSFIFRGKVFWTCLTERP